MLEKSSLIIKNVANPKHFLSIKNPSSLYLSFIFIYIMDGFSTKKKSFKRKSTSKVWNRKVVLKVLIQILVLVSLQKSSNLFLFSVQERLSIKGALSGIRLFWFHLKSFFRSKDIQILSCLFGDLEKQIG